MKCTWGLIRDRRLFLGALLAIWALVAIWQQIILLRMPLIAASQNPCPVIWNLDWIAVSLNSRNVNGMSITLGIWTVNPKTTTTTSVPPPPPTHTHTHSHTHQQPQNKNKKNKHNEQTNPCKITLKLNVFKQKRRDFPYRGCRLRVGYSHVSILLSLSLWSYKNNLQYVFS